MVFGEPRLTSDIDLIVKAKPSDASRIFAQFPGHAEVERWATQGGVMDAWRRCLDEAGEE